MHGLTLFLTLFSNVNPSPWRHATWVKEAWFGPGVEPGPFGQIYRAAGTVVFPTFSVLEAAAGVF